MPDGYGSRAPATQVLGAMRVGVAFPWSGIRRREHGSAQRIGLLIDLLRERVGRVTVVSPGLEADETHAGVVYRYHRPTLAEAARERRERRRFRTLLETVARTPLAADDDLWLWRHLECRIVPSLADALASLVRSSDVVLASFSFWAGALGRLGRAHGVPIVVTVHDEISGQVRSSRLVRWLTYRAEMHALRSVAHCFVGSSDDRAVFGRAGVDAEVLLPGVDLDRGRASIDGPTRASLQARLALGGGDALCLFVGAAHGPNAAAAEAVCATARTIAQRGRRDVRFVIAGDVVPPGREANLSALGRVDEAVLDELYRMADLVLVPLTAGTGISRKTLEAMAFGKPVLTTTVGTRGIPVESGTHAVVCDDLPAYPDRVLELLADEALRRRLAHGARAAVAAYDYRVVDRRYLDVITALARARHGRGD